MDAVLREMGFVPEDEQCGNRHACNIFFGNYMEPDADPKIYDQVSCSFVSLSLFQPKDVHCWISVSPQVSPQRLVPYVSHPAGSCD